MFQFEGGAYTITLAASDGIRLYIDGVPMLDRWLDQPAARYFIVRTITPGSHRITVEYYSANGSPAAQVFWEKRP
jgi:type IV pilus assembly protein PilY1